MVAVDPIIPVAFTLTARPGTFAVLVGSGVSRAAGIPTGWEVLEEIIRRVALLEGEDPVPGDPTAWYVKRFGQDPTYSGAVEMVARTPADRQALLRELLRGDSEADPIPTPAHHALARLIRDGAVKVVLTTNFDRLLEQACTEIGVDLTVLASPDTIAGSLPLVHAGPVLIKLHGDQADPRIKNTDVELDTYDPAVDRLLDQIFDEYGLIVSGWSGVSDVALRAALLRCQSRRFSTYWTTRRDLAAEALPVAKSRAAEVVQVADADEFFSRLADACDALRDINKQHPISIAVAVAKAKRELAGGTLAVSLHDLIRAELGRVESAPVLADRNFHGDGAELLNRLKAIEADCEMLTALIATSVYWGTPQQDGWWFHDLSRYAANPFAGGSTGLINLLKVPALLMMWSAGIAAVAAERWDLVARLLTEPEAQNPYSGLDEPVVLLVPMSTLGVNAAPLRLYRFLKPIYEDHLSFGKAGYLDAWEAWHYVVLLFAMDESLVRNRHTSTQYLLRATGRHGAFENHPVAAEPMIRRLVREGSHPLLEHGLFGSNLARLSTCIDLVGDNFARFSEEADWGILRRQGGGGMLPSGPHLPGYYHGDPDQL